MLKGSFFLTVGGTALLKAKRGLWEISFFRTTLLCLANLKPVSSSPGANAQLAFLRPANHSSKRSNAGFRGWATALSGSAHHSDFIFEALAKEVFSEMAGAAFRCLVENSRDADAGFSGRPETNHAIVPTIPRTDEAQRSQRVPGFLSILIIGD